MKHRKRLWARTATAFAIVTALASLLVACAPASGSQASAQPAQTQKPSTKLVAGSTLAGRAAPNFTLTDQNGNTVSLAALKGHPIFLTFMDATCTQECPITAQWIDWTANFLGPKGTAQVKWLVVSVNPSNTPADAHDFITKNKVTAPLDFLMGTQAQLAPVWHDYGVAVVPTKTDVQHSVANFLIDSQGREVEYLDGGFDPKNAAHDLQLLLQGQ
jgi:cytochrome oxidase Cu insertion factor (SCO1/SenC/PrrC family)